ncbi:hypothetical protein [Mesorhizobium sp. M0847]|uniref:hypothetical protein n=1 Tax=unclassified Mesorhizobium TaxID=325217 RepID=UPI0033388D15
MLKPIVFIGALIFFACLARIPIGFAQSQKTSGIATESDMPCIPFENDDIALSVFNYYKTHNIISDNIYIKPVRYGVKSSTDTTAELSIDLYYAAQQSTYSVDVAVVVGNDRVLQITNVFDGEATDAMRFNFCGNQDAQSVAPDHKAPQDPKPNPWAPQADSSKQIADLQKKEVGRLKGIEINLKKIVDDTVAEVAKHLLNNNLASFSVDLYVNKEEERGKKYIEGRGETALEYHNKRAIETNVNYCKMWPDDSDCR